MLRNITKPIWKPPWAWNLARHALQLALNSKGMNPSLAHISSSSVRIATQWTEWVARHKLMKRSLSMVARYEGNASEVLCVPFILSTACSLTTPIQTQIQIHLTDRTKSSRSSRTCDYVRFITQLFSPNVAAYFNFLILRPYELFEFAWMYSWRNS